MDRYKEFEQRYYTYKHLRITIYILIILLILLSSFLFYKEYIIKFLNFNRVKDIVIKTNRDVKHKVFFSNSKKVSSLYTLERNFKYYKSYSLAIKISKNYFYKKDYKKAIYWSIKASQINPSLDLSWIIYAKSQYYLRNARLSKIALKKYLNRYRSKRVYLLLKRIESFER